MATDGVQIIDGDDAYEKYWNIINLYDNGAELFDIEEENPLTPEDWYDGFEQEIHVTSVGLAYWEIGLMTKERLRFIKEIIAMNACVEDWMDYSEEEGAARKLVLEQYMKKISNLDRKPRARIAFKERTDLLFDEHDLLTFKLKDNSYCAVICARINHYRGDCSYFLVPTTYKSKMKPNFENLKTKGILGIMGGPESNQLTLRDLGLDETWKEIDRNSTYPIGNYSIIVEHDDLLSFKDKFETIGSLEIKPKFLKAVSLGYESTFERFETIFGNLEEEIEAFKYCIFPIRLTCQLK